MAVNIEGTRNAAEFAEVIEASDDRFHAFERTMRLNCFGCLRVTRGQLPGRVARRHGHSVNIARRSGGIAGTAAISARRSS